MATSIFNWKKTVVTLAIVLAATAGAQAQWSGTINVTTNQTLSTNITLTGNTTVNISPGVTLTVTSVISGSYSIKVTGGGKAILSGANTYTGQTTVDNATLQLGNGTANGSIDNTSNVVLSNATAILRFEPGANMTFSKVISGLGKVEYKGSSSAYLFFTADNTYSGTTTIESGFLDLGQNTTAGGVAGDIINNGNLLFFRTTDYIFPKVISGTGRVWKFNTNKVTLTGANIYTGNTTINEGTLQIGDGTSGSIDSTSNVVLNNANAILRFEPGENMVFDKLISGSGSVEYKGSYYDNKKLFFTADNTYTGTTTIEAGDLLLGNNTAAGNVAGNIINKEFLDFCRSNTITYNGVISGTGQVYVNDVGSSAGKVILTGANIYTGSTYITNGTLQIGDGTSGSIANTAIVQLNEANAILRFEPGANMIFDKVITGNGSVEYKGGSNLYFTADNNYSGTTTIENGYLYIGNAGTTGSIAGNIINNWCLLFNRSNDYTYSGAISGTGTVRKLLTGKLTLNGVNTFTGVTRIQTGTLALGASGSVENSSLVYLYYSDTKFDISAGSKKIKGLQADDDSPTAEVILGANTLTIGAAGQAEGYGDFYGIFSGTGNVIKQGTGEFYLTNYNNQARPNTATGIFTLKEGLLGINGRNWAGNFTQNAGTTLEVKDAVSIAGNLSLGGGNIAMDLTEGQTPKITVGGAVSTSGTTTFKINADVAINNYALMQAVSGITSTTPYALDITGMYGSLLVNSPTQLLLNAYPTAIDNVQADNLKIYPNPVKDYLRFTIYDLRINKIEILDLAGKTIVNLKSSIVNQINVANLPSGVYFLKIQTDNGVVTKKFVKE